MPQEPKKRRRKRLIQLSTPFGIVWIDGHVHNLLRSSLMAGRLPKLIQISIDRLKAGA